MDGACSASWCSISRPFPTLGAAQALLNRPDDQETAVRKALGAH